MQSAPSLEPGSPNSSKQRTSGTESYLAAESSHASCATDSRFSCNICLDAVTEPVVTQCGHLYCWPCMYQWLEPGMLPEERMGLGLSRIHSQPNETRRACPVCKAPCSVTALVPIYVRNENDDDVPPQTPAVSEAEQPTPMTPPRRSENQGLRRRLNRSAIDDNTDAAGNEHTTTSNSNAQVPARPPASSPLRSRPDNSQTPVRNPPQQQQLVFHRHMQESPNRSPSAVYLGSLTRGMALMLQQQQQASPSASLSASSRPSIPPLQRLADQHGNFRTTAAPVNPTDDNGQVNDPDASEVLSRLLLLLGSFVILCLLLF